MEITYRDLGFGDSFKKTSVELFVLKVLINVYYWPSEAMFAERNGTYRRLYILSDDNLSTIGPIVMIFCKQVAF